MITIGRMTERNIHGEQAVKQRGKVGNPHQENNMTNISQYISVITINVNGLNSPIKRNILTEWIKKHDLTICCI